MCRYARGCKHPEHGQYQAWLFDPIAGRPVQIGCRAVIAGGHVIVAGPEGYCIDGKSFSDKITGGFAMLASCASLTNGRVGGYVDPVIMTVTVLPRKLRAEQPDAATLGASGAVRW
jgi:hypothetical protein